MSYRQAQVNDLFRHLDRRARVTLRNSRGQALFDGEVWYRRIQDTSVFPELVSADVPILRSPDERVFLIRYNPQLERSFGPTSTIREFGPVGPRTSDIDSISTVGRERWMVIRAS